MASVRVPAGKVMGGDHVQQGPVGTWSKVTNVIRVGPRVIIRTTTGDVYAFAADQVNVLREDDE